MSVGSVGTGSSVITTVPVDTTSQAEKATSSTTQASGATSASVAPSYIPELSARELSMLLDPTLAPGVAGKAAFTLTAKSMLATAKGMKKIADYVNRHPAVKLLFAGTGMNLVFKALKGLGNHSAERKAVHDHIRGERKEMRAELKAKREATRGLKGPEKRKARRAIRKERRETRRHFRAERREMRHEIRAERKEARQQRRADKA